MLNGWQVYAFSTKKVPHGLYAVGLNEEAIPGVPTPIVSPRDISEQPIFKSSSATYATFDGGTAPSTGQPTTHDMYLTTLSTKFSNIWK